MKWTTTKSLSLFGTIVLIPWDLFMGFGFTFSARSHEPFFSQAFVWTTFWFTVPAVLLSWFMPRLSGVWVLVNTGISVSIAAGQLMVWYLEYRRHPYELSRSFLGLLGGLLYVGVVFWAGKIAFGFGMVYFSRAPVTNAARIE